MSNSNKCCGSNSSFSSHAHFYYMTSITKYFRDVIKKKFESDTVSACGEVLHLKSEKGFGVSTNAIYSHVIPAPELGPTAHFKKPANKCLPIVEFHLLIRVFKPGGGIFRRERKIKEINLNHFLKFKSGFWCTLLKRLKLKKFD